ncbi:MAG: site-specific integrase [Prevotella copri]|nr:site-specific integrase [Segatella copri]
MGRKTKQNHITTPELIAQINPENARLVKDYLTYLRSMNRSDTTIEAYKSDLDIFFVWVLLNANNKFFIDITKRDLVSYQNWLINENENSPARVRRLKAVISSLSNYIENILDDEYPNYRSIVKKIENPVNTPVRAKTVLDESDCNNLLNKLVELGEYQKACMFALAMASGRRKSELVRFKVSYFDDSNVVYGSLYRTPEKVKSKGRGKQGKLLHFYVLVKQFKPYFDLWMQERERLGIKSEWLFPDPDDATQHLSAQTLNSWAKTFSAILGVDFYWHSMRHHYTTYLSEQGIPDNVIQEILGWFDISLVSVYRDTDVVSEIGKYFCDGEIVSKETIDMRNL